MSATDHSFQPSFFDSTAVRLAPPDRSREKIIKRVFERANRNWRTAYSQFIVEWLTDNGPAIAETIRLEYESRAALPQLTTADKRASGHVFVVLVKNGLIERTGQYGWSVERSSPMPYYRAK